MMFVALKIFPRIDSDTILDFDLGVVLGQS